MRNIILAILIVVQIYALGQDSSFNNQPWKSDRYPIVIDPYQGNSIEFSKLVKDKQVAAIIHKASQGLKPDTKYPSRSKLAKSNNLLYASYHLGTNSDPIEQADFYLNTIKDNPDEPTALDIEDIGGNNISLKDAEKFINRIYEKTNHYPFVYVNNKVFNAINSQYDEKSVFAKCPLWYARFLSVLPKLSTRVWEKVTLWQFSCEINCSATGKCLYNIPGTRYDIDVNVFNGTSDNLKLFWANFK